MSLHTLYFLFFLSCCSSSLSGVFLPYPSFLMQDEKTHHLLIDALDAQAASNSNVVQQLTLLATSLACCYLWESDQRGKDVGRLELSGLMLSSPPGHPDLPAILDGMLIMPADAAPVTLLILPTMTKTTTGRGKALVRLQALPPSQRQYCFVHRLHDYLQVHTRHGHPISQYLFRPQTKDGKGFFNEALSTGAP